MDITIRNEREEDYRLVEELTREAFWNLYVPGCDEHFLVNQMRSHPDFIKELAFVAEMDGRIVGSIMNTRSWLISESGIEKEIVTFGPLCVHPDFQRKGIGTKLIAHTASILRKSGVEAIVIMGDPHNYCKHGFRNGKDLNISDMNGEFPHSLLAIELIKNSLENSKWKYKYSDVYNIDQSKVDEFDKRFPPKTKEFQYSQELFSINIRSYLK